MTGIHGIRPFVPARDYPASNAFYAALGFEPSHADAHVTLFTMGGHTFILQNFFHREHAENTMVQLMVERLDDWWAARDLPSIAARFGAKPPIPPAMQHWGLRVGYVFDPSGVLWHIAERPA